MSANAQKGTISSTPLPSRKLTPELRTFLLKEELLSELLPVNNELIELMNCAGLTVDITYEQLAKVSSITFKRVMNQC